MTDRADAQTSFPGIDPRAAGKRGRLLTNEARPLPPMRVVIGKTILHMLIRTLHKTAFLYIILHNLHIYNRFTFLHSNNCFVVFIIIYSIYSPIAKYCRIFKHVFIYFYDTEWSFVSEYFFHKILLYLLESPYRFD